MHSLVDWQERYDEVEAMVKAAGGYVKASDDLRPRVLETARTESTERRGKWWIRQFSIAAAVTGVALSIGLSTYEQGPKLGPDEVYEQAVQKSTGAGGFGWALVQVFLDLREDQSKRLQSDQD
jgi:hypothetical protein